MPPGPPPAPQPVNPAVNIPANRASEMIFSPLRFTKISIPSSHACMRCSLDTVREGQVLATLDSDNLNSAQISINSAQLQLETAQKELERSQVLYENDGITQQALETAENSVRSAQLQL